MIKFLILLAVVNCALAATLQPKLDGRIVGGSIASITNFPWQVSLQLNSHPSCAGTIYSKNVIVTAAHCLLGYPVQNLTIRAGSSFWKVGGAKIEVANYKIHENYDSGTFAYDIGVMRLKKPLIFSSTIQPIPLASVQPLNGAPALISGWGVTELGSNSFSTVLRYITSNIVSNEQCRSPSYGYADKIHSTMICAATPEKDACQKDSGGALVSDGVLVGVVSWGIGCAYNNYPGVYANVAVLKSWIEQAAATV